MKVIKLIVGLANPGSKYISTRHNVGSWYVRRLAKNYNSSLKKELSIYGYTTRLFIADHLIQLFIPDTYMNICGKSIAAIANLYQILPEQILIAHDELNLIPGRVKFKMGGGHNGHNGLKNIISSFSGININVNFTRLRIGIGRPLNYQDVTKFVLDEPSKAEKKLITDAIDEAIYCTEIWLTNGIMKAMNRLHSYKTSK
ncbi:MAG: aminoacyl-tRNA hydrolase [Candidatus Dasytiphilus stammeri]